MLCQVCGTANDDERDQCVQCGHKLFVVSGEYTDIDQESFEEVDDDEQLSFDEHLLERISILEEVVRRTASTARRGLETMYKLEQKITVNDAGIGALRDLLVDKRVFERSEWSELWERRADRRLLALEKRERFAAVKERIAGLYAGSERDAFRAALTDADERLLSLDVDGAVRRLDDALAHDPENYELAVFLAETFFNEGRIERALAAYEHALTIKADHFDSLVFAGVLRHEMGREGDQAEGGRHEERAVDLLGRAVELYPDDFLPSFALGAVHAAAGRAAQAVPLLERALEADDGVPQAHRLLGSCRLELGQVGLAIESLGRSVALDRRSDEAYQRLGMAYLARGWNRKALDAFRTAERLRPSRLGVRELLAMLGRSMDEAEADAGADAVGAVLDALAAGRGERALALVREALAREALAREALAREALVREVPASARAGEGSSGDSARDPSADEPMLLLVYAGVCLELDRLAEVEPAVYRVLRHDRSDPVLESTAWAARLEALRAAGELDEAERAAGDLLATATSDRERAVGWTELAYAQAERRHDLDAALASAERAVELAPEALRPLALSALGWVRLERGEADEALDRLDEARTLDPTPRTLAHYGMACLDATRREASRRDATRREASRREASRRDAGRLDSGRLEQAREALEQARDARGTATVRMIETLQGGARRRGLEPVEPLDAQDDRRRSR